jgi:YVTN family beta-propeller protein
MSPKLILWALALAASTALWSGGPQTAFAQPSVIATIPIPGAAHGPYGVAVNPTTNRMYVTNIHSGNISVIDTGTDKVVAVVPVGEEPHAVDVNTSTNRVYVTNSQSDSVSVLDGATDTVVATVPVEAGPHGVAVNAATNRIYVANHIRGTVSVIDGAANTVVATIPVGELPEAVAVNPVTNRVYVGSPALRSVSVIDGATNAVVATVPLAAAPWGLSLNPTTNRIYVSAGTGVVVVDGGTDSAIATVPLGSDAHGVAVNASTNRIYAAAGALKVIDGDTNSVVASVTLDNFFNPQAVTIDPPAHRVYVTIVNQGSVEVIDTSTNTLFATLSVADGPRRVAVNPETDRVYVTNWATDNLSVIDGTNNTVVATVPVEHRPYGLAVNPTTNRVYVANTGSNSVSVIDATTNTVITTVAVGGAPYGLDVNPTTNRVYVANSQSGNVSVIDGTTNEVIATVTVGNEPRGVAVNPATDRTYVAAPWGYMWVIDGTNNTVIATVTPLTQINGEVAVNPITNLIYLPFSAWVNMYGGALQVVDGATNTVIWHGDPCLAQAVAVNSATNRLYLRCHPATGPDLYSDHLAVVDGASNTVLATVDLPHIHDGVAMNPSTGRIYVASIWDGTVSVISDPAQGASRNLSSARTADNPSFDTLAALPVDVPAARSPDSDAAYPAAAVANARPTAGASSTPYARSSPAHSKSLGAPQDSHQCILGPNQHQQCLKSGGNVVNDPTCPAWSRLVTSSCIEYGAYSPCGYKPDSYCWLIDSYAIPTNLCPFGLTCPQEYAPYGAEAACWSAGGLVETREDPACLTGTVCAFYEAVSEACETPPAVGGIAQVADIGGASAEQAGEATGGSGWSAPQWAALAAGLAAAALGVGGVAWYARRRWQR